MPLFMLLCFFNLVLNINLYSVQEEEEQAEETGIEVELCVSASGKVQTSQSFETTAIENSESPNACKISEVGEIAHELIVEKGNYS